MTHSLPAEHAQHDLDLIAGHAAGDLTDTQRIRAGALLQSCTSCAELRRDLIAIASATRTLPATSAPRDFQLSPAQAARLRRGGWIKSLLRPFAAPQSIARPMATAFTSLGLAGLLVTSILPSLIGGSAASAPMPIAQQPAASAAAAGGAPGELSGQGQPSATDSRAQFGPLGKPSPVPVSAGSGGGKSNDLASAEPDLFAGEQANRDRVSNGQDSEQLQARAAESNPIVSGSLVLLVAGLALFGLRFLGRRAA
jgi:hypothetical protein